MPYDFALAAAPIIGDTLPRGALLLQWPSSRPPQLSAHERDTLVAACQRMGALLQDAAPSDGAVTPAEESTVTPGEEGPARGSRPARVQRGDPFAAEEFANRLPEGCCSLDAEGRITFLSDTAADLLGRRVEDSLGALLWEALPWLDNPVFEDRYRAAAISHRATSVTVRRSAHQYLDIDLHPDAAGVSLRITPTPGTAAASRPGGGQTAGMDRPHLAGSLYDVMHLAASLAEAVSVRDVVELAADQIMPAFGAQGFVVSVAEGGKLHIVGQRGYRPEVISRLDHPPFRDDNAPTVRVLTTASPLFFASPREMAQLDPDIPRLTERAAWAFLPLIASGHPVGCCVVSFDQPHPFGHDERAVLTSLAALLAQALDRARLYDAEHQLAHELQTALLPASLPDVPGLEVAARYLPTSRGMDIGGDFYDVICCGDTTIAATIGDVQGHNANAAALMGQVRTGVHASAGAPPGEVLARTNRLLTDLDTGLFTSCLYAHLDLARHRVQLASAGHMPPLLRHPDGRTEILHLPPGLLLGIDPAAGYQATEIPLPPGAVLALYTDGLVESPGRNLDDAIADLADHLARAPHRSMDDLADALVHPNQHSGLRHDDMALLLLHTPRGG
nr:SpoIIE family protein phosphatase [Streptomyces reniochalinae]